MKIYWIACVVALTLLGCGDDDDGTDSGTVETDSGNVGTDAANIPLTCSDYCSTIMANCSFDQYMSLVECNNYCMGTPGWTDGTSADTSGNTLGCRIRHAGRAGTMDPTVHCPHAGPSGGNTCGTWCEVYCDQVAAHCTGADEITFTPDCATVCAGYGTGGESGDLSGDTVQCRVTHSGVPASVSSSQHCPHAGVDGGGTCI